MQGDDFRTATINMIKKLKEEMKTKDDQDCWHTVEWNKGNNLWYENRIQYIDRISEKKVPSWNKTWNGKF